ncbi:hypothetical protein HELRODRAFT_183416 [Helobdella robusta]|uniref:Uncharacterized protein n=1 Tax=Helobdella robusta TaxID=6412 RepID=T1FJL8_HELRO|nr:hypothetical protein HELRODRAFT_183416 [Helobdella robusta]ESO11176.1 hypothetical protein HELRODRAFT_183416 [Helobdella robusta]
MQQLDLELSPADNYLTAFYGQQEQFSWDSKFSKKDTLSHCYVSGYWQVWTSGRVKENAFPLFSWQPYPLQVEFSLRFHEWSTGSQIVAMQELVSETRWMNLDYFGLIYRPCEKKL